VTDIVPPVCLSCAACGDAQNLTLSEMVAKLRGAGLLKARSEASPALVRELCVASAAKLKCPHCGRIGLAASAGEALPDEEWGQARACEGCRRPIAAERLEALPHARLCASCQSKEDRGELSAAPDYCPRCGDVMQLVATRAGITRYVMRCPSCRK
jgi:hypothetical protein